MATRYRRRQSQPRCRRHGTLLVFDEIIEAFARTRRMFACEHYVAPDVLGESIGLIGQRG